MDMQQWILKDLPMKFMLQINMDSCREDFPCRNLFFNRGDKMKKYLSIDNGLLMLCMSLFLFMMFICTQLLVSGYIENRTPEEIYVVNEKQITEHQLNQLSHIF